jgi:aryl sulfotransferase
MTAQEAAPPGGPPPWISSAIQQQIHWRDGDIVIAVPPKSGTTWTMNIVHQLRSGGDAAFEDIYIEVPWLEFVASPDHKIEEIVAEFDSMSAAPRRAFKTHSAPPTLPYRTREADTDVHYLVVARNPDEAIASFRPFLDEHSDAWYDLWGVSKAGIVGPDFQTYFDGFVTHAMAPMIFGFAAAWWSLRDEPNVMLVHYADLKRSPDETIPQIAEFLGFEVPDEQWPTILQYTSFSWMKAHEDMFELRGVSDPPILNPGGMLRKGQVGTSNEDGITPEISAAIAEIGRGIVTDPAALRWLYEGNASIG